MPLKNTLFFIILCFSLNLVAQHTISGNLYPAEDYKWLIAYQLNPDNQNYIADTEVKNGDFTLNIPANAATGMFRLVYAVPQEEFYFDVIYNGKEDIVLTFDSQKGLSFIASKENSLYTNYFKEVQVLENKIVQFYSEKNIDRNLLGDIINKLVEVQKSYEKKSEGMVSEHFVSANRPYFPSGFEDVETYVKNKKHHYFDALDFNDPILQGSAFLNDKAVNYVFTALPFHEGTLHEKELQIQANIDQLSKVFQNVNAAYKAELYYSIWTQATDDKYHTTADYIYENYLKSLATQTNKTELLKEIETHNRLRLGALAPEVTWINGNVTHKLSDLSGAINYVLVFWSSTCSHCLEQLPELQKGLKGNTGTKVLAIGLEDDDVTWKKESAKLPNFIHGIALGKWESPYTKIYDIHQTPTYYILDREKRIVDKPENYEEVIAFLKGRK